MRTPRDRVSVGEFYNDFEPCRAGLKAINPQKLKEYPQWSEESNWLFSPHVVVKLKTKPAKGVKEHNPWVVMEHFLRVDLLKHRVYLVGEFKFEDDDTPVYAHVSPVSRRGGLGTVLASAVDLILTEHPKAVCFEHPAGIAFVENRHIVGFTSFFDDVPELTEYMKDRMMEVLL